MSPRPRPRLRAQTAATAPVSLLLALLLATSTALGEDSAAPDAEADTDTATEADTDSDPLPEALADEDQDPHRLLEPSWTERFRWAGETLYYSVEILGGEAARAALSIGPVTRHEEWGPVIPIQGLSSSTGFFDRIYPMRNTGDTYLNPETGAPYFSEKLIDERGSVRTYAVTYERSVYRADVRRVRDGTPASFRRFVPSDIHDGFSWIYDMRSRDLSIGHEFIYYIYDGWRLSRLTFRILSHQRIDTPIGVRDAAYFSVRRDVLDSWPLLPWAERTAVLPPVFQSTMSYTLGHGWISLDDERVPIGVELDSPLGPIRMMISRHTPAP